MEIKTNKSSILISAIFFVLLLVSCDSKRVYDTYFPIYEATWNLDEKIKFPFEINDTITRNNLFINIRNTNEYAFSNLFLITELKFPNGKKIVDTLEYEMADATGKFLGNGFTELKNNKLFYKEHVVFPMSGNYEVSVSQAMRKSGETNGVNELEGITDVGFRIEKEN